VELLFKKGLMARLSTVFTSRYLFNAMLSRSLADPQNLSPRERDEYFKPFRKMSGRIGIEKAMYSCTNLQYIRDWQEELSQLEVPTLLIYGKHDRHILEEHMKRLAEAIPNSKLLTLEKAGHFIQEDQPSEFAKIVKAFLSQKRTLR